MSGRERHLVTVTPSSQLDPIISHDGMNVAYTVREGGRTVREGGRAAGFIIPASGGKAKKVCDECILNGWFADNRRILALNGTSGRAGRVRSVDVVDGMTTDLVLDPRGIGRADVSPDNRWLSFAARRQVWIAPLRPGHPPAETEWVSVHAMAEGSAERACGWSPDGRLLYLLLERDGFRDLYAQRVDPIRGTPVGQPFVVQHLHDPQRRWGSTPFGTAIVNNAFVFNQIEMTGSIWLVDPAAPTE